MERTFLPNINTSVLPHSPQCIINPFLLIYLTFFCIYLQINYISYMLYVWLVSDRRALITSCCQCSVKFKGFLACPKHTLPDHQYVLPILALTGPCHHEALLWCGITVLLWKGNTDPASRQRTSDCTSYFLSAESRSSLSKLWSPPGWPANPLAQHADGWRIQYTHNAGLQSHLALLHMYHKIPCDKPSSGISWHC